MTLFLILTHLNTKLMPALNFLHAMPWHVPQKECLPFVRFSVCNFCLFENLKPKCLLRFFFKTACFYWRWNVPFSSVCREKGLLKCLLFASILMHNFWARWPLRRSQARKYCSVFLPHKKVKVMPLNIWYPNAF